MPRCWRRASSWLLGLSLALAVQAGTAHAGVYDVDIRGLGHATRVGAGLNLELNQAGFDSLVRDLGLAFAPRMLGPANTLGSLGFSVATELSFTRVDAGADYWQRTTDGPSNALALIGVRVRKGLPFSVEIGGSLTHLLQSGLYSVGTELTFSPLEGFRHLPDLALRAHIRAVLGARDMSVLVSGADAVVSKEFGIGGIVALAPYVGYSLVYVYGTAQATAFYVDPTVEPSCQPSEDSTCARLGLFDDVNSIVHRGIFGVELIAAIVSVGFEVLYAEPAQTYTIHVGLDF